ncbi:hypothetical protein [Neobacillus novalis]|nr:hypothetical protein [Neobacillus novalis]
MEQTRNALEQAIDKQALVPAGSPLSQYGKNYYASVYCLIPIKVWELSNSDAKQAEAFLHSFYQTYQGKEVDTNEAIRFMASYFKQKDAVFFKDWVAAE